MHKYIFSGILFFLLAHSAYAITPYEVLQVLRTQLESLSAQLSGQSQVGQVAGAGSDIRLFYRANENSGTSVADTSGKGNNGTITGAKWGVGKSGSALEFDGSGDQVNCGTSPTLDVGGAQNATWSFWMYPQKDTEAGGRDFILERSTPYSGNERYGVYYTSNYWGLAEEGTVTFQVTKSWTETIVRSQGKIPVNTWSHVGITYDGTSVRMYINGDLDSTTALDSSKFPSQAGMPCFVGSRNDGTNVFNGRIDDLRMYARALSLTEMRSDMNSSSGGTVSPTPSPSPVDTQAPSVPLNLSATAVSASQIALSWTASTDDVGVTGYRIYRGGAQLGTVTGTTYQDSNLQASTAYTYTVAAYDAAGNTSTQSASRTGTTQGGIPSPSPTPTPAPSPNPASPSTPLSLSANTWTKISPVTLQTDAGSTYNNRAWTSGSYDSRRGKMIVWDGYVNTGLSCPRGYSIYSNSVWTFDALGKTLTKLRVQNWTNPGGDWTTSPCPENSNDPTPANSHPAFVYVEDTDSVYSMLGLNARLAATPGIHPNETWKLNLGTNVWTKISTQGQSEVPANGHSNIWPAMTYDPSTRNIVIANAPATEYGTEYTWLFNVDTERFTRINQSNRPYGIGGNATTYDTRRALVWLFGAAVNGTYTNGGNELWHLNTNTKTWTLITPAGVVPPTRIYHGFVYIPRHDVFVLYGGSQGEGKGNLTDTWIYNPTTNQWSQLSLSNRPTSERFIDMVYDEMHDAVLVQTGVDTTPEWWAFRYVPGGGSTPVDTTPPSTPTNLSGAVVSGTQIDLAWTASTDNAGLQGYQVERCTGASCSNFTHIATPSGVTFSNTVLTQGTTYQYRVRAVDTSGNYSAYSTVMNKTTPSLPPPPTGNCTNHLTDPNLSVAESTMARPALYSVATDPNFPCTPIKRITDQGTFGDLSVPTYSQLQAWNSDQSLMLITTNSGYKVLNASTYQQVQNIDWGYPDYGQAPRWSPTEPHVLYYIASNNSFCPNGASLMKYKLQGTNLGSQTHELVQCFPEYSRFAKDQSFESLSVDGRYIGLMGVRASDARFEAFLYDVIQKRKGGTVTLPQGRECDHIQPSPAGRYAILACGQGTTGFNGFEIYDLNMNHLRNIHQWTDHADQAVDQSGEEWLVVFNNQIGNGSVAKKRLRDGYEVELIRPSSPSWLGSHVSCQSPYTGWCTYSNTKDAANGWEAREGEIIKVYLDSTLASPHIERLVHHRSDRKYVGEGEPDNCPSLEGYWADPHQTTSPDGSLVLFGSSWGQNCNVEAYVLNLGTSGGGSSPFVTLTASPLSVSSGGQTTLSWSSTNSTSCTASGGWTGTKVTSGTQSVTPTTNTTYTLTCTGSGGSATQSVTVTVSSVPQPTLTLTAFPSSVTSGGSTVVNWSTTDATSCTASGGWTGTKAVTGSQSVTPSSNTTYTLTCTGGGGTVTQSVTVTVVLTPSVTLSSSPSSITTGQSSTLTWSSTNSTSCTASGGWTGTKATSGTQSVTPGSNTTYTLTCTGAGGTATQDTTVTVSSLPIAPPVVSITATPSSIAYGGTSVVSWSSSLAQSCSVSNGSTGTNGSFVTPSLTTNATYTATCTGGGGQASQSVTVTVAPQPTDTTPPTVSLTAPGGGATVGGNSVSITASASDNVGVAGVHFTVNGENLGGEDTVAPYAITWDTTLLPDGTYTLSAKVRDQKGNQGTAQTRSVTVKNTVPVDTTPPTVTITEPGSGITIAGSAVALSANATDNVGVTSVQFTLDGQNYGAPDTTFPYGVFLNTTLLPNGSHTIGVIAKDAKGNTGTAGAVTIAINNQAQVIDTQAPTVPQGLSVVTRGTDSLSLTWALSADNVGVTGYHVERCEGNTCTNFREIGISTGNAYKDGGLSAATTYRYRVRATDATKNHSGYSEVKAGTTEKKSSGGGGGGGGKKKKDAETIRKSGLITPDSRTNLLLSAQAVAQLSQGGGTSGGTKRVFTQSLYVGLTSPEVRVLQEFLKEKGLLASDGVTGFYGNMTLAAVKQYQCQKGIACSGSPDQNGYGLVGERTRAALNTEGGTASVTTAPSTPTVTYPTVTSGASGAVTLVLYKGMNHPQVATLQQFLMNQGYLGKDVPTTFFGNLTDQALKRFQCEKLSVCSGTPDSTGYGATGPRTRGLVRSN